MTDKQGYCRGCGKMILFLRTQKGALMPCDTVPVRYVPEEHGTLLFTDSGKSVRGRIVDNGNTAAPLGWISHFATCTKPPERKKKQKKGQGDSVRGTSEFAFSNAANESLMESGRIYMERKQKERDRARSRKEQKEAERRAMEERQVSLF